MTKPGSVQVETDATILSFGDDFSTPDTHCLMHSEVSILLEACQTARQAEEAAQIQAAQAQADLISPDLKALPPPTECFMKAQNYVSIFGKWTNKEVIRELRQSMLQPRATRDGLYQPMTPGGDGADLDGIEGQALSAVAKMKPLLVEWEAVQVANLCPKTVQECRTLIPSITHDRVDDIELQRILDDLHISLRFQQ